MCDLADACCQEKWHKQNMQHMYNIKNFANALQHVGVFFFGQVSVAFHYTSVKGNTERVAYNTTLKSL